MKEQNTLKLIATYEKMMNGLVKLLPMSSANRMDDIYTKALILGAFQFLYSKSRMSDIHS